MPFAASAFQRLLEPLDRREMNRIVAAHDGDHGVGSGPNAWTCVRHLRTMLFAKLHIGYDPRAEVIDWIDITTPRVSDLKAAREMPLVFRCSLCLRQGLSRLWLVVPVT